MLGIIGLRRFGTKKSTLTSNFGLQNVLFFSTHKMPLDTMFIDVFRIIAKSLKTKEVYYSSLVCKLWGKAAEPIIQKRIGLNLIRKKYPVALFYVLSEKHLKGQHSIKCGSQYLTILDPKRAGMLARKFREGILIINLSIHEARTIAVPIRLLKQDISVFTLVPELHPCGKYPPLRLYFKLLSFKEQERLIETMMCLEKYYTWNFPVHYKAEAVVNVAVMCTKVHKDMFPEVVQNKIGEGLHFRFWNVASPLIKNFYIQPIPNLLAC